MSERNTQIEELVESTAGYAGNLYNGLEQVVGNLRADRIREGLTSFSQAAEGLDWMLNSVALLNEAGGKYGGFETEGMTNFLAEVLEAVENSDYVLLADLIEYEIMPIVDEWGKKLDGILETNE